MKRISLDDMSVEELVDRFASICIAQDQALLYSNIAKFNRHFDQMRETDRQLKSRPGDQRRALLSLYDHENAQVRLQAARVTLAVEPEKARKLIEEIANGRKFPQAGDAGMTIVNLDRGVFKPS